MFKNMVSKDEIKIISEDVLVYCYGINSINDDMIDKVSVVITSSLEKIMTNKNKKLQDAYPYIISEDEIREIFEKQHNGRDLTRSRSGTYRSPQIAAIWNQHINTARVIEKLIRVRLEGG